MGPWSHVVEIQSNPCAHGITEDLSGRDSLGERGAGQSEGIQQIERCRERERAPPASAAPGSLCANLCAAAAALRMSLSRISRSSPLPWPRASSCSSSSSSTASSPSSEMSSSAVPNTETVNSEFPLLSLPSYHPTSLYCLCHPTSLFCLRYTCTPPKTYTPSRPSSLPAPSLPRSHMHTHRHTVERLVHLRACLKLAALPITGRRALVLGCCGGAVFAG